MSSTAANLILAAVVAVSLVWITYITGWKFGPKTPRLRLTIAVVPVISERVDGPHRSELKVLKDGVEVPSPHIIYVTLENTGDADIPSKKFDEHKPLAITLPAPLLCEVDPIGRGAKRKTTMKSSKRGDTKIEFAPSRISKGASRQRVMLTSVCPCPDQTRIKSSLTNVPIEVVFIRESTGSPTLLRCHIDPDDDTLTDFRPANHLIAFQTQGDANVEEAAPLDIGTPQDAAEPPMPETDPSAVRASGEPQPLGTIDLFAPTVCRFCGGGFTDGHCTTCGVAWRQIPDQYTQQPTSWAAGTSSRGSTHTVNQDALIVLADGRPQRWAGLVVCDGIAGSANAETASSLAARRAAAVLADVPGVLGKVGALTQECCDLIRAAVKEASNAAASITASDDGCSATTIACAIAVGNTIAWANVGDSRVYWVEDGIGTILLSKDDIEKPTTGSESRSPILTQWLGKGAPSGKTHEGSFIASSPGWLMVCSDGLSDHIMSEGQLTDLIASFRKASHSEDTAVLTEKLVHWALASGGEDDVSVALTRVTPSGRMVSMVQTKPEYSESPRTRGRSVLASWVDDSDSMCGSVRGETSVPQAPE